MKVFCVFWSESCEGSVLQAIHGTRAGAVQTACDVILKSGLTFEEKKFDCIFDGYYRQWNSGDATVYITEELIQP